jgi:hypothetical protein
VYTEARTVLRAEMTDFFFNWWCLVIRPIIVFGTYQGASTFMRRTVDWKRSRISVFEMEDVPDSCIPYVQIGLSIRFSA